MRGSAVALAATALVLTLAGCGLVIAPESERPPPGTGSTDDREVPDRTRETIGSLPKGEAAEPDEQLESDLGGSDDTRTMEAFLVDVLTDVDTYWSGVFAQANFPEPQVGYAFPGVDEPVADACSQSGVAPSDAAAYCPLDDKIVVSEKFALDIWNGRVRANDDDPAAGQTTGDFSVAYVVAHEYAHSLQAELGLIPTSPGDTQQFPTYATELHADCWSGVWARSAYDEGQLEPGDVEEAITTAELIGDYAFAEEGHHGTPDERRNAFITGYESGVPGDCQRFLAS